MLTLLCKMMKYPTDFKPTRIAWLFAICFSLLAATSCSKPPQPKDPTEFTSGIEEGGVMLKWSEGENADFYRLYRKDGNNRDFKYLDDTGELQYCDTRAKSDVKYSYKITAVNGSNETEGVVLDGIFILSEAESDKMLTAPRISTITKLNKFTSVVVFDSDNMNCTYQISRCRQVNGEYEVIASTSEKAYYDNNAGGGVFYYTVTATDGGRQAASVPQKTGYNARSVYRIPVMMYHEFVTQSDLDNGILFDEYAVWEQEFESDLQWIRQNGYTTITSKQIIAFLEGKEKLPPKPILLTIDDGKYGVYKRAYPLLKKYNMTATLSLIGKEIDAATQNQEERAESGAPYCTWEEIAEMQKSGYVEMVSHTQSLHVFSHDNRCGANCAEGEALEEFLPSAQVDFAKFNQNLKNSVGITTQAMAYPYSKRSPVSDAAWLKSGYKLLLCGDSLDVSLTQFNYFIAEAGINSRSALVRRVARMTGTPLQEYISDAISE